MEETTQRQSVLGASSAAENMPTKREPVRLPFVEIALPQAISDPIHRLQDTAHDWRRSSIEAAPNFIVNNSSNFLGLMHLGSEMMMFKAANAKTNAKPNGPIDFIVSNVGSILRDAKPSFEPGELSKGLFNREGFIRNQFRSFRDLDYASAREMGRLERDAAAQGKPLRIQFSNRWQMRSTLFGLLGWSASALIPEAHDKKEDVEQMANLAAENPLGYVGTRLKQAVWVPEWSKHKTQFTGLSVMVSGVCSALSGFRTPSQEKDALGIVKSAKYTWNKPHTAVGLVTLLAGTQLLFALDDESAYSRFGSTMWARMLFLPKSIYNKYMPKEGNPDPGRHWYVGGTGGFQIVNTAAFLLGGAEKNEDGTVVDHKSMRDEAKQKAKDRKKNKLDIPTTRIHTGAQAELLPKIAPEASVAVA